MQRLIIFIDGSYLFKAFKSIREQKLGDSEGRYRYKDVKMSEILSKPYYLVQKRYYGSINSFDPTVAEKQARYHTFLRRQGFENTIMDLKIIGGEHKEKGVDGSINVDMNELARENAYEVAILVAADGDFTVPGVTRVQERYKKKVINASFRHRTAYGLKAVCDGFVPLDSLAFVYHQSDPLTFLSLDSLYTKFRR